jgi:hypothetical protein
MKIFQKIFSYTISMVLLWGLLNTVLPYWEKYWLERQLETFAVYGTKHSIAKTREMMVRKIKDEGYDFNEEDFIIQKDEDNSVSINIAYSDEINVFGLTLTRLEFLVEAKAFEAKGYY